MNHPLRVLMIGDASAEAIAAELRAGGYEPLYRTVNQCAELRDALGEGWDIAIADFQSRCGPLDALRIVQEAGIDLPVIVVSGRIKDADVLSVLKAGAADHLPRGNLMRLNAAVERELRSSKMRRDRNALEEQFRQAQKMEAVGRLAGGVAHDFNNLLTVITGYSDLLLSGFDLADHQRSALEQIRRSAERGGALTNQLLSFSRKQPLETRTVHVNHLVMHTEKMLRRLIGEDIELVVIPAAGSDVVEADPGRLEQVILNLAVNARDAMPDGGKLTIETAAVTLSESFSARQLGVEPGRYVMLTIGDNGVGMDAETLSHLFEPFFTTKRIGRGTGLGLATAYGIIRQSRGAIRYDSELGKGTTASVFLPLAPAASHEEDGFGPSRDIPGGAETVLVVEDEARVRKLIVDVLSAHGYKVVEATRGEEALRLCRQRSGKIDLAVLDVVMPEMSGPDLARQVMPSCPGVRLLYISGYTDEAVLHHGIPESGAAFLQKPFLPDALLRAVREVLDARTTAAQD
jgi:signal transduction histidine kinase/ActR/RegA family two-component response regulator